MHMNKDQIIVSKWLEKIGKERDIHLSLEEDGHCIIPCADNLHCIVEVPDAEGASMLFIYFPLVMLPKRSDAQLLLLKKALEKNLFGLLTGGCHIAFDARSNYIVLSFSFLIEALDEAMFKNILGDMLKIAPNLRQHLQITCTENSISSPLPTNIIYANQVHLKRLKISPNPKQSS